MTIEQVIQIIQKESEPQFECLGHWNEDCTVDCEICRLCVILNYIKEK